MHAQIGLNLTSRRLEEEENLRLMKIIDDALKTVHT